ncbi:MAG: HepT-like ribonuclease domain-containing protein [Dehalococcoidia bacterium]
MGEAASGVSPETKTAHPELPWAKMAATRNRLIHGYFSIDLQILWKIATEDLEPVIATLRGVVEQQD